LKVIADSQSETALGGGLQDGHHGIQIIQRQTMILSSNMQWLKTQLASFSFLITDQRCPVTTAAIEASKYFSKTAPEPRD